MTLKIFNYIVPASLESFFAWNTRTVCISLGLLSLLASIIMGVDAVKILAMTEAKEQLTQLFYHCNDNKRVAKAACPQIPSKLLKTFNMNHPEFFSIVNKGVDGLDNDDVENRAKALIGMLSIEIVTDLASFVALITATVVKSSRVLMFVVICRLIIILTIICESITLYSIESAIGGCGLVVLNYRFLVCLYLYKVSMDEENSKGQESPLEDLVAPELHYAKALALGWACCQFEFMKSLKSLMFEGKCTWWSLGKICKFFGIIVLMFSISALYFSISETIDDRAEFHDITKQASECLRMKTTMNETNQMEVCTKAMLAKFEEEGFDPYTFYQQDLDMAKEVTIDLDIALHIIEAVNSSGEIIACTTLLVGAFLKIPKLMEIFLIWSLVIIFTTFIQLILHMVTSITHVDTAILYIELWIIACFFNFRFFISVFKYKKTHEKTNDTEELLPIEADDEPDFEVLSNRPI